MPSLLYYPSTISSLSYSFLPQFVPFPYSILPLSHPSPVLSSFPCSIPPLFHPSLIPSFAYSILRLFHPSLIPSFPYSILPLFHSSLIPSFSCFFLQPYSKLLRCLHSLISHSLILSFPCSILPLFPFCLSSILPLINPFPILFSPFHRSLIPLFHPASVSSFPYSPIPYCLCFILPLFSYSILPLFHLSLLHAVPIPSFTLPHIH